MRTSPCVALPFGSDAGANACVGTRRAPAPSRLAQRDVAKTCEPGKRELRLQSLFPSATFWPLAQGGKRTSLAWRTCLDCARRTEKQEETDSKTTTQLLYLMIRKIQTKKRPERRPNPLILLTLVIYNSLFSRFASPESISSFRRQTGR